MGAVYRAKDTKLGREVAIKVLPEEFARDADRLARFEREAKVLASLKHPNIVSIYSVEECEGQHYLIMELVEGTSLEEEIAEGRIDVDRVFDLAIPLANALAAAHAKGITHRDLKPGNIMIEDGNIKVLDLGLAKLEEEPFPGDGIRTEAPTEQVTRAGQIVGTVAYMSPEQAEGKPVDWRSDIFSLGVVLYEMATGQRPFVGDTNMAVLTAIIRDTPPPVTEVNAELPNHLGRIVRRCLEKDPELRYQTAQDLRNDLASLRTELLEERLSGSTPEPIAPPAELRAASRPPAWRWAALALVVLIGIGGLLFVVRPRPERAGSSASAGRTSAAAASQNSIAVLPFGVRGGSEVAYLGEGLVDLISTKVDGAGELRAVNPPAVLSYIGREELNPSDPLDARRAAEHFGAGLWVVGNLVEAGDRLHISASLYQAGREDPFTTASVEGPSSELFSLVDDLAAQLITEQISGTDAEFNQVAAVTTSSLPALKSYLQGEALLRQGRFQESMRTFERTVDLDPDFALGWYRLSVAAEWAARNDIADSAGAEALARSERLSDHYRQLLEARVASRRGEIEEAERLLRAILAIYPTDVEAWHQLSELKSHYAFVTGESMTHSREPLERVLAMQPDDVGAMWHLARVAAIEGNEEELDRLVARVRELNPQGDRPLELKVIRDFTIGTEADRQESLDALAAATGVGVLMSVWNMAMATDNFDGSIEVASTLTTPDRSIEERGLGHVIVAYFELARGDWEAAQRHIALAAELTPGIALETRAYLSAADFTPVSTNELWRLLEELEAWEDDTEYVTPHSYFLVRNGKQPAIRLYLMARIGALVGDERTPGWIEELEGLGGPPNFPHFSANLAKGARGFWYRERGERNRALAEFASLDEHRPGYQDVYNHPLFGLPAERLARAELLHEVGRTREALKWLDTLREISFYDEPFTAVALKKRAEFTGD